MAGSKKITELTALTAVSGDDLLVIVDNPSGTASTRKVTVANLLGNSSANVTVANSATFSANSVVIRRQQTPANSSIAVTKGSLFWDSDYLYIAVDTNTLKRVSLESF